MKKLIALLAIASLPARASYTPPPLKNSPPAVWSAYSAFGDGITNNAYLAASQGYPALMANDFGLTPTILTSNSYDCIIADGKIFPNAAPAFQVTPMMTWLPDAISPGYAQGSTPHEQINDSCRKAGLSWMAIPATYKVFGQSCTQTGTWTNDTTYGGTYGVSSNTNASTLACPITTTGAPIYAWYRIHDNDTGSFTYSIDGGSTTTLATNGGNLFSYPVDGTHYGVASIRMPSAAGAHTVTFNVSSATGTGANVDIIGLGTSPNKPYYGAPSVFLGGQLYELNDQYSSWTAKYNADELADAQQLQADGLPVYFVDVRKYLNSTSDMTGGGDQYSPNATGQAHIKDAFEGTIQAVKSPASSLTNPLNYGAVCNTQYFDGRGGSGTVSMTANSNVISIAGYTFKQADQGTTISMNAGAGGSAGVNTGIISTVDLVNNRASLSVTPTVTTTGGYAVFGHDDTAAFATASAISALTGLPMTVPNNCGVRNFIPASNSGMTALNNHIGYNYTPTVAPTLYTLLTGFSEDTYKYGINISGLQGFSMSGFSIKGVTFPYLGLAGIKEACVGTATGTQSYADGIVIDTMTFNSCPVGLGVAYGDTPGGHLFGQSRHSEFANNGDGMYGSFSDWVDENSIFTGNFDAGIYLGLPGTPGYQTASVRMSETRFEENGRGLVCAGCNGLHLEGVEFQFNHGYGLELGTGWAHVAMTGGMMQYNGQNNVSSFTGSISGNTLTVTASASGNIKANQTLKGAGITGTASFVGSASGTTLTVTAVNSGTVTVGQTIVGTSIPPNTTITALGTGTGGAGTYTLSGNAGTPSETIIAPATYITGLGTGTGGVGTYTVNNSQAVASESMSTSSQADIGTTGAATQGRLFLTGVQFPSISSGTPDYIFYGEVAPGDLYEIKGGDLNCNGNSNGAGKSYNVSMFNWVLGVAPTNLNVDVLGCPRLSTGRADFSENAAGAIGIGTASATAGTAFDLGSNTNSMLLPRGTTGQEPSATEGMLRYNITTHAFEGVSGASPAWGNLGGTGPGVVLPETTNTTVLASNTGTAFTNTGAAGTVTFTLPTAAAGLSNCFYVDAAQPIVVAADAGHTIRNGGAVTAAGGNLTSASAIGGKVCVKALNSSEWFVESINGSWTVN